jgi:anti-sigma B factor antagonist
VGTERRRRLVARNAPSREKRNNSTLTEPRSQVNFQINDESIDADTHVIELGGEVDLYTAPEFKERLVQVIEDNKKHLVVDLSKATFIDSTTLGVLVGGVKRLRPSGGSLALVCTDQNISKIFEITGLDRVFPIFKSRDEALQSVGGASVPPGGTS